MRERGKTVTSKFDDCGCRDDCFGNAHFVLNPPETDALTAITMFETALKCPNDSDFTAISAADMPRPAQRMRKVRLIAVFVA